MTLRFSCTCGQVTYAMPGCSAKDGTHLMCYCKDCRAGITHLDRKDLLAPRGGTRIFQTRPDKLVFETGEDQLRAFRLSPKGLVRWYAACCSTPIAATLPSQKLPFVGLLAMNAERVEDLGPELALGFTKSALPGDAPELKDRGLGILGWRFIARVIGVYLTGKAKVSPFFEDGKPKVDPEVLTLHARQSATS